MKQWFWSLAVLAVALGATWFLLRSEAEPAAQAAAARTAPVNVAQPRTGEIRETLQAVGTARARHSVDIASEVDGRIVNIHFSEGQRVSEGQLLVTLDQRQARANVKVAEARLKDAEAKYQRAARLQSSNSISASEVDELTAGLAVAQANLESARTQLENLRIEAPFDGVLGLREVSVGAWISAGQLITTLDSIDRMLVRFQVPQRYLGQLKPGQDVAVSATGNKVDRFSGEVSELGSRIDPLSRTLTVQSKVDNPDGRLRPGQFLNVALVLDTHSGLLIPEQAVLTRGPENFVFTVEDGMARRTTLILGSRLAGEVEVVEGLTLEDRVVINGQQDLSTGDRLRILRDEAAILPSAPVPATAPTGGDGTP